MSLPNKYIKDEHNPGISGVSADTICGDPKILSTPSHDTHWYPLRIYHSSLKRQQALHQLLRKEQQVESTYVPQRLLDGTIAEKSYTSALVNYIFLRTTLPALKAIKADKARYDHLRYVMRADADEKFNTVTEIAHIPDRQMESFMLAIDRANHQVELVQNLGFALKPGQQVRVTDGPFKGVEGVLKSIKKHLCVVVALQDVMAIAITGIHRRDLQKL